MANIIAFNEIIALNAQSNFCQPRVGLLTPSNNTNRSPACKTVYYIVLVDLPNIETYPAPNATANAPAIQADGSILFPYKLADGSELPDDPPAGVPMITYALPVYGCNPQTTEDNEYIYYPSVYFGKKDNKHKGIVKSPKETNAPSLAFYPVYQCQPFVIRSSTFHTQLFIGTLVFIGEEDICTSWEGSGTSVSLVVQQASPASSSNVSFQGFTSGSLQPSVANGITNVSVVFSPDNSPSGQAASQFSYSDAAMVTL